MTEKKSSAAPNAAAIVVAGGKSSRLGRDKASELLLGRPLLQHVLDRLAGVVDEIVVVRAEGQTLPELTAPVMLTVVEDVYAGAGPLAGIQAGLAAARAPVGLVVGCDMPLLQGALLAELLCLAAGHDLVVPLNEGLPEPLCAAYARTCLPAIEAQLAVGEYKVTSFYGQVQARFLQPEEWRRLDPDGLSFLNVNDAAQLQRVTELLDRSALGDSRH